MAVYIERTLFLFVLFLLCAFQYCPNEAFLKEMSPWSFFLQDFSHSLDGIRGLSEIFSKKDCASIFIFEVPPFCISNITRGSYLYFLLSPNPVKRWGFYISEDFFIFTPFESIREQLQTKKGHNLYKTWRNDFTHSFWSKVVHSCQLCGGWSGPRLSFCQILHHEHLLLCSYV